MLELDEPLLAVAAAEGADGGAEGVEHEPGERGQAALHEARRERARTQLVHAVVAGQVEPEEELEPAAVGEGGGKGADRLVAQLVVAQREHAQLRERAAPRRLGEGTEAAAE